MRNRSLMFIFSMMCSTLLLVQPCYAGFFNDWTQKIKKKWSVKTRDPLLPYVLPDKKITQQEHLEFLKHLTPEQRLGLRKNFEKDAKEEYSAEVLAEKFHKVSNHVVTEKFKVQDYHREVKWLAKQLGVHKVYLNFATTFQLENLICQRLFISMWEKMSPEQRKKVLIDSGIDPVHAAGMVSMGGAAVIAGLSTMAAMGGFTFYILMAKTVVVIASLVGVPAATTISAISVMCGPVGWGIAAVAVVAGVFMIWGGADMQQMAGFVVQTHLLKVNALQKSKIDPDKYIWKDDPELYK